MFLALLLERLEAINPGSFVPDRAFGDAAAARGSRAVSGRDFCDAAGTARGRRRLSRPVTIVDAGWRRDLDLEVIWPRTLGRQVVAGTIWPEIEDRLLALVERTPVDDHLRQQSPDGREADVAAERAGRSAREAKTVEDDTTTEASRR